MKVFKSYIVPSIIVIGLFIGVYFLARVETTSKIGVRDKYQFTNCQLTATYELWESEMITERAFREHGVVTCDEGTFTFLEYEKALSVTEAENIKKVIEEFEQRKQEVE